MEKFRLNIILIMVFFSFSYAQSQAQNNHGSAVFMELLKGKVINTVTNEAVTSGQVRIFDSRTTPETIIAVTPVQSNGSYTFVNIYLQETDGIRIMAYPSDISWDGPTVTDSWSNQLLKELGEPGPGPVSIQQAHVSNNTYTLDIFVDWVETVESYELRQNYPNPFNPSTTISFGLPVEDYVSLKIYDMTGKEVAVLYDNEFLNAGVSSIDFSGENLSSGIYFYRLTTTGFTDIKKMTLIK